MKYKLEFTKSFQKGLKKAEKRGLELGRLKEVVEKLQQGEALEEKYRDHKLKGTKRITANVIFNRIGYLFTRSIITF